MQLINISKTALTRMSKAQVIILFFQLRKSLLLEIEDKTKKIEKLSKRIEKLEQEKDTRKRKDINKASNQPSSKKPEWDKDGNLKTKKKSRQKGRKKRLGCGNRNKDDIIADETNHNLLNQCPDCGKDLTYQEASEQPTRIVEDIIEPPSKTIIFKEVQERKWCSACQKIVSLLKDS